MKKLLSTLIMIIMLASVAYADSRPLPAANTDIEIIFSDIDWYSDYSTTMRLAKEKWKDAMIMSSFKINPVFGAAHWDDVYAIFGGGEKNTGCGLMVLPDDDNAPKVGGYKVDDVMLYLMFDPEKGYTEDYEANGAMQFYMVRYTFDVTDKKSCYEDLVTKLKSIYGDNPYVGDDGTYNKTPFTAWVNQDGAMVAISYRDYEIRLVYMAPGAEEKLYKVEKLVKQQEIDSAADDLGGL